MSFRSYPALLEEDAAVQTRFRCLFISTDQDKKELSKNTISFWLCEVTKRVYQSSDREDALPQYCTHEVWRIAPTLLFKRNLAVNQVLKAEV